MGTFFKFICRLSGIDTPEMKPKKDKVNRDNEIIWAKKARSELLRLICDTNFDNLDIKKEEVIKTYSKIFLTLKEFDL
jgi:endonuclease YncB( thermonuclease family)